MPLDQLNKAVLHAREMMMRANKAAVRAKQAAGYTHDVYNSVVAKTGIKTVEEEIRFIPKIRDAYISALTASRQAQTVLSDAEKAAHLTKEASRCNDLERALKEATNAEKAAEQAELEANIAEIARGTIICTEIDAIILTSKPKQHRCLIS